MLSCQVLYLWIIRRLVLILVLVIDSNLFISIILSKYNNKSVLLKVFFRLFLCSVRRECFNGENLLLPRIRLLKNTLGTFVKPAGRGLQAKV